MLKCFLNLPGNNASPKKYCIIFCPVGVLNVFRACKWASVNTCAPLGGYSQGLECDPRIPFVTLTSVGVGISYIVHVVKSIGGKSTTDQANPVLRTFREEATIPKDAVPPGIIHFCLGFSLTNTIHDLGNLQISMNWSGATHFSAGLHQRMAAQANPRRSPVDETVQILRQRDA